MDKLQETTLWTVAEFFVQFYIGLRSYGYNIFYIVL